MLGDKEVLVPGTTAQYEPENGISCGQGRWSPCGGSNQTIKEKQQCNLYECPYHAFDPDDHFN